MSVTIGRLQLSVELAGRQGAPAPMKQQRKIDNIASRYHRRQARQAIQQERMQRALECALRASWMM